MPWFKGNFHCHSDRSDGLGSPQDIALFYKERAYDFLGISDHNQLTPADDYSCPGLLGIPCCEYTAEFNCHVVGVGVSEAVAPNFLTDDIWKRMAPEEALFAKSAKDQHKLKVLILQDGIDKILRAGGIPVLAHPLWHWAYDHAEMMQLSKCSHFEICNASPDCNSFPMPGKSFGDELWDKLLSASFRFFGCASDDAHMYFSGFTTRSPFGSKGFNMVFSSKLSRDNILESFEKGRFYATTGVLIESLRVTERMISISILRSGEERLVIDFIGKDGKLLKSEVALASEYKFQGDELYVRIRVSSSSGVFAWTQPVFLDSVASWRHVFDN